MGDTNTREDTYRQRIKLVQECYGDLFRKEFQSIAAAETPPQDARQWLNQHSDNPDVEVLLSNSRILGEPLLRHKALVNVMESFAASRASGQEPNSK